MKNGGIDLIKEAEEFANRAKNLDELAKLYKNSILELQSQIHLSELSVSEAEQRAASAEQLAQEAQERYRKAIALRDGQYDQLIHDLFEAPQKELTKHIAAQARKSNTRTASIALASMIVTMVMSALLSLYFQKQNLGFSNNLITRMDRTMGSLQNIEGKTETVVENIWSADPNIKRILRAVLEAKKDFSSYQTRNDLVLAYKVRLGKSNPDLKYADYLKAFRVAGLDKGIAPTSEAELSRWDSEYLELCKRAISILKDKDPNALGKDEERAFATYKVESDDTDYLGWEWSESAVTCRELLVCFEAELSETQRRIDFNK